METRRLAWVLIVDETALEGLGVNSGILESFLDSILLLSCVDVHRASVNISIGRLGEGISLFQLDLPLEDLGLQESSL